MQKTILALFLAGVPSMQAGWITWTQVTPVTQVQGTFTGGTGAYAGTVTATVSGQTSGTTPGVNGLIVQNTTDLTSDFLANYPTNPGPVFPNFGVTYNDSVDQYTVTVDFTGLANGVLPSGSLLAILDVDILENLRNLGAVDASNASITTAWLSQRAGVAGFLDYFDGDGNQTGSLTAPAMSNAAGVYQFLGSNPNNNAAMLGYVTTQEIRSFSFLFNKSNNASSIEGTGGYGISIGEVPEPATGLLLSVALLGLIAAKRRV